MTARDLARFGLLLLRGGEGVGGQKVGSKSYIHKTLARQVKTFSPPRDGYGYSNQAFTNGRWLGHSGYGGQFLMVDMASEVVCVLFSVLENDSAYDPQYSADIVRCLESICQQFGRQGQ